ncbi:hypothetical protein [Catenuloplanes indicus]|uniref:Uncharacterized protein n=1 Tax=Catenuloplanes indicus TaxID=137267 RepID=A0AAE3WAE8_9ACTN|nr:hypothetical protein [Catenuloplanes indicus]MDQ0371350.1 hypothetical protein [Catenuloplanes indicus]
MTGDDIFDHDITANFVHDLDDVGEADRLAFVASALRAVVTTGHDADDGDRIRAVAATALIPRPARRRRLHPGGLRPAAPARRKRALRPPSTDSAFTVN